MKVSYRNILPALVLVLSFMSANSVMAEETATTIMQRCADKFRKAPALDAQFAIADTSRPISGTLSLSRSRFRMKTPLISIWYDGKTQWTYIDENKEVNITEPTKEELMESNPFEVIANFNSHYKCRKLKSAPGTDIIELMPKSAGQAVSLAKITIDRKTGWPTAINITFSNGNSTSVSIVKINVLKSLPASTFTFDKKAYPVSEIVDLR